MSKRCKFSGNIPLSELITFRIVLKLEDREWREEKISKEANIIKAELLNAIKSIKMTMTARMTKCIFSKRIKVCALSNFNHVTIEGNNVYV